VRKDEEQEQDSRCGERLKTKPIVEKLIFPLLKRSASK
jgi:hypothetical protein